MAVPRDLGLRRRFPGGANLPARPAVALIVLAVVALAAGWPLISGGRFQSDDFQLMRNLRSRGPLAVWFRNDEFFRPATTLDLFVEGRLGGWTPSPLHASNLVLHVLASWAVFLIARARAGSSLRGAWIGALAFCVLPAHAEPVGWISGRTDLLAAALGLLAIALLLGTAKGGRGAQFGLGAFCLAAALLSKESAAILPLVIALMFLRREQPVVLVERWRIGLATAATLLLYLGVRAILLGRVVGGYAEQGPLHVRPAALLLNVILFPFRAVASPAALVPGWSQSAGARAQGFHRLMAGSMGIVLAVALLAGIAAVAWALRSKIRRALSGLAVTYLACFWIACLPVIAFRVSFADSQGERFLYLPSAFLCLALGEISSTARWPNWRKGLLASAGIWAGLALHEQFCHWRAAGELAEEIVRRVARDAQHGPVVVLSAPDNLRGAYVLRNGLREGVDLVAGSGSAALVEGPLLHEGLLDREDSVQVSEGPGGIDLQLMRPGARFLDVAPGGRPGSGVAGFRVVWVSGSEARIKRQSGPELRALYFSSGHMREWRGTPPNSFWPAPSHSR